MSGQFAIGAASVRAADGSFDSREFVDRVGRDLARLDGSASFVALTWPVPRVPCERLLAAENSGSALLWAPPADEEASGLGAAFSLEAQGVDRFQSIQAQAREVWAKLDASRCDVAAPKPRFFGGLAFQPGQAESGLWRAFGDARFVLPELAYLKNKAGAWLRLVVRGGGWDKQAFRAELEPRLLRALSALFTPPPARAEARELQREERSESAFAELVAAIQDEIKSGRAQKIVAARRVSLTLDRELLPDVVHGHLRDDAPESTRFAFRVGGATFLGATPEQLVQKRGVELSTEAVAGSINTDDATASKRLLESDKDIREHEFVVSEILRLLAPLMSELTPSPQREVHRLRTVLHLRTPIQGKLREPNHVLDLVARLHPTPAVGGVPTRAAIDFILRHEPDQRGWYSGPFGWFDERGDGRFVVALRCGVVAGKHAELYAGAGVVADSNAPSEFAETRWKLAALLGALGVSA
ncbi:MAG TPA: isochorismate synthase [Polyangiaceae bacterium]|nr:isochorismate synthase [Polyangiaceae bacterium]